MTEPQFELVLAAIREQSKELHAIRDALRRLRGISYAVYIILPEAPPAGTFSR